MFLNEYMRYDAIGLAHLIHKREISAVEALDCALQRVNEVNPLLNAVVLTFPDYAKKCLKNLPKNAPFYGVPLLVKDLGQPIRGIRCTEGSRFFATNIDRVTSDLVNNLLSLGFIPFAKTNTPELGLCYVTESILLGPCRNPYDLNRTCGGSSGGSAAAVAAGIAPIATASDGGGSIRVPASCCGLFGFKPTKGLISAGPLTNESWSGLAVNFVLTRSLRDSKALFDALADSRGISSYSSNERLNIIHLEGTFPSFPVEAPFIEAVHQAQGLLSQLGHTIQKRKLVLDFEAIGDCTITLIAANTYMAIKTQEMQLNRNVSPDDLEPITWDFYQRGRALDVSEYLMTKNHLYQLVRPLLQLLKQTDVILTPSLAQLPLLIGELKTSEEFEYYLQKNHEFSPFTSLFNQAGLPAMTLPIMFHHHLPISIQLGSAPGNDLRLYSLAKQLQSMLPDFSQPVDLN